MSVTPRDRIVAHVYDKDCITRLGLLHRARACEWIEVNSRRGWGTFEVPLADASTDLIDFGRVVRLTWLHKGIANGHFDMRIKKEATQLAVDGIRWLRFEQQPGILDFLGDAGVDPEGGLEADSPDTRNLGFMSPSQYTEEGFPLWYVPTDWIAPRSAQWGTIHRKFPPEFASFDKLAEWISVVAPDAQQAAGNYNYFRASLTLTQTTDVRIAWAADNYGDFYVGTELVGQTTPPEIWSWRRAQTIDMRLDAGTHLFAVRVKNARNIRSGRENAIAIIASVREIQADDSLGDVLLRTNATDWLAHDDSPQPGWHAAQALHRLVVEGQNRGVDALQAMRFGYHLRRDSHGRRWTDRDQFQFAVDGPSLAEIAAQLAETEMDVWIRTHGGPKLMAAINRGRDRSATVQLYLGDHVNGDGDDDGTLKTHEVAASMPTFTFGKVRLASGRWITVHRDSAVAAHGRIEAAISLGSSNTDQTSRQIARGILEQNDSIKVEVQSSASTLEGAVAYKDYKVGDVITVPGRRNAGTMKARVLAIHVRQSDAGVDAQPEYVQDESV